MKYLSFMFFFAYFSIFAVSCGGGGGGSFSVLPVSSTEDTSDVLSDYAEFGSDVVNLTVELPSIPSSALKHLSFTGFKLTWIGEDSKHHEKIVSLSEKETSIKVRKNNATPILAYPLLQNETPEESFFIPAGSIYPDFQTNADKIYLNWGFSTCTVILNDILLTSAKETMLEKQFFCSYFNWKKLQEKIDSKNYQHRIEKESIENAICTEDISAGDIKETGTYTSKITLPQNIPYLYCKDITQPPVYTDDNITFSKKGEFFLSDDKKVYIEISSGKKNTLVITELAM